MPHTRIPAAKLETLYTQQALSDSDPEVPVEYTDVFIAGSGPIGATFARTILQTSHYKVMMADIGSQDSKVVGEHHKNSIKYQKDIDTFVNVIKGALQPISVPPGETYIATLGGDAWTPSSTDQLIFQGSNPNQNAQKNLKGAAITRTVGGMATHWTCACPFPNEEEQVLNPIKKDEFKKLLDEAHSLLNVHSNEYDFSIRHTVVKETLEKNLPKERKVGNLPLAVERRKDNPEFVTWTGPNTVLGDTVHSPKFDLRPEHRVTKLVYDRNKPDRIKGVLVRDLANDRDFLVVAKAYVIACGSVATPQILEMSRLGGPALGKYLCEQSLTFCQIVLKREIVEGIWKDPRFAERVAEHHKKYPKDPLPIPFDDPEPQVIIPYTTKFKHHVQVHRDAFSYGDVGPRADSRVVVDLRFFGKQDIQERNLVDFGVKTLKDSEWVPGVTDIYGMPQATFDVERSRADAIRDQEMMNDMTNVANLLGAYLPGSEPQFMEPGLALHITGTTRIGNDPKISVANESSRVHGIENLWVGGNGNIPDSTACNPTLTSTAIALKAARNVLEYLGRVN
ncbi:pyranose 2-oxidase [Clavulina sp. PMI_390]|nr:pyranose 2-oxidase [Clavulina sp. PMI_390]